MLLLNLVLKLTLILDLIFNINVYFFTILGGSLKKIAKKITTNVPINKNV